MSSRAEPEPDQARQSSPPLDENTVADLVSALTVADANESPGHSRLFSTREELQDASIDAVNVVASDSSLLAEIDLPGSVKSILMSSETSPAPVVQTTYEAAWAPSQRYVGPSGCNVGYLEVDTDFIKAFEGLNFYFSEVESNERDVESSSFESQSHAAPENRSSSPLSPVDRSWQKSNLRRKDIGRTNAKRPRSHEAKVISRIQAIQNEAKAFLQHLEAPHGPDLEDPLKIEQFFVLLDKGDAMATQGHEYLRKIRRESAEIHRFKAEAINVLRSVQGTISVFGGLLPPRAAKLEPEVIDCAAAFDSGLFALHPIAQIMALLGCIMNVIMNASSPRCAFILNSVFLLIQLAMTCCGPLNVVQSHILDQCPRTIEMALKKLGAESRTICHAKCPDCSNVASPNYRPGSVDPEYPSSCPGKILGATATSKTTCGADLLVLRNGKLRPKVPYMTASIADYLAREFSDPEVESFCDKACDEAFLDETKRSRPQDSRNPFDAEFLREFEGPSSGHLFIDRQGKGRVVLAIQVDFFSPNGMRVRGNRDSIGIISLVNLALPEDIRYNPEHMHICGIIPGPEEPKLADISFYMRPIIDEAVVGWSQGYFLSQTASFLEGRHVQFAFVMSINDLPAARKVSGTAGHGSHYLCTVCDCFGTNNLYNTDFEAWPTKDVSKMRYYAECWRDADSLSEREAIFKNHGIRWSEFWRLPYWNPTKMLVVDGMHCILEGLVHYHCRYVLQLDSKKASAVQPIPPAFLFPWPDYDAELSPIPEKNVPQLKKLFKHLTLPLAGPGSLTEEALTKRLHRATLPVLKNACLALNIETTVTMHIENPARSVTKEAQSKSQFVKFLIKWRKNKPWSSDILPSASTASPSDIEFVQKVIAETTRPTFIGSVPKNYGEFAAGTIKADEWRVLSTLYLPIALTILWGDNDGSAPGSQGTVLDHTMALFQAVMIACRYSTNADMATEYRSLLRAWVDNLHSIHPHTEDHSKRPNVHVAFHIYDFLQLFGPIMSWWCFPFERLIGTLQKINTNQLIGGPLESTILTSYLRGANIRRWLGRTDCPVVIKELKRLFDLTFSRKKFGSKTDKLDDNTLRSSSKCEGDQKTPKYYIRNGANYSCSSTHRGNSIVFYYPPDSIDVAPGSIEKIEVLESNGKHEAFFYIKRQAPLPSHQHDPFRRFPWFPAVTYSQDMLDGSLDKVPYRDIVSHAARFDFSHKRSVLVNLCRFADVNMAKKIILSALPSTVQFRVCSGANTFPHWHNVP